ncbi:armadillo-type protein [Mycena pura]|uniref:Armadillo-type protein n=1 Tax=Mycena pura TaxID=153505 RepID=A0AAD6VMW6_9AGAR|nr:armadillo-type protein [Mycena pura]
MVRLPSDVERGHVDVSLQEMHSSTVTPGLRTMTEFCDWIQNAEDHIRAASITDISWWECKVGLKHQSILLRFEHTGARGAILPYYVTLERAGRATFNSRAIDKATISESPDMLDEDLHLLFFALVRKADSEILPKDQQVVIPAFHDFLDHKWRGPPATLQHLASYLRIIISREPNYTLWSSNCFWFSRHVMHVIGLRHYSFRFIAFEIEPNKFLFPRNPDNAHYRTSSITDEEWLAHDPSSVGLLFRFLHYEEWRNGILLFRRLLIIIAVLISCGVSAASGYGLHRGFLAAHPERPSLAAGVAALIAIGSVLPVCGYIFRPTIRVFVALLTQWTIRGPTAAVLQEIEGWGSPEAVRGDFIPSIIPLYRKHGGYRIVHGTVAKLYTMRVVPCEREPPDPWEREQQIYAPGQAEYCGALEELRNKAQDCDPLLECTPEMLVQQNRCKELVRVASVSRNPDAQEDYLWLLFNVCRINGGAEQAVLAGADELAEQLISSSAVWRQMEGCDILGLIAPHVDASIRNKLITKFIDQIKSPQVDVAVVEHAIDAIRRISSSEDGAKAAIAADAFRHIVDRLEEPNPKAIKFSASLALKTLTIFESGPVWFCTQVLRVLRETASGTTVLGALHTIEGIAAWEQGVETLIEKGFLEDLALLLQSPDAALRKAAVHLLAQMLASRKEEADPSRSADKFCGMLVHMIQDPDEDVVEAALLAICKLIDFDSWAIMLREAAIADTLSELGSLESGDTEIQHHLKKIVQRLVVVGSTHEAQTSNHASSSR